MNPDFDIRLKKATDNLRLSDPALGSIIDRGPRCDLHPHSDYFRSLAGSIIGQQLSVKAAATIRDRFGGISGTDFPSPEQVIKMSEEVMRSVGLSRAKVAYVKDLATHVLDGRLDFTHISTMTNEEIIGVVSGVKGIGEWTAHMFLIFCVGRLDVLPTGDLGVRKGMQTLYGLPELPSPVDMQAIAERNRWTGYESVASWYVWRSLENIALQ